MDVLDTVVKVLEALEHLTIIIGAFGALWTVFKMTEENRASMKVTIRNDFGYTLKVRCPQADDNPTWQVLSMERTKVFHQGFFYRVSLFKDNVFYYKCHQHNTEREATFEGNLFGTPTIWCHIKFGGVVQRFKIYKSGDPKDGEVICRIWKKGIYVDDILKPCRWEDFLVDRSSPRGVTKTAAAKCKSSKDHDNAKTDSNGTTERQPLMDFSARTPAAAFVAHKVRLVDPSPNGAMRVESDGIPKKDPLQNDGRASMDGNIFIDDFNARTRREAAVPQPTDQRDVASIIAAWSDHHADATEPSELDDEFDDALLAPLSREQLTDVVNAAVAMDSDRLWQAAVNALCKRNHAHSGVRGLNDLSYNDIVRFMP